MVSRAVQDADREIGKRVKIRRLDLRMSQEKLGDAIGVTFQQIQKYEKGTNRISVGRLQVIAKILKVPVAYFFNGDGGGSGPGHAPITPPWAAIAWPWSGRRAFRPNGQSNRGGGPWRRGP